MLCQCANCRTPYILCQCDILATRCSIPTSCVASWIAYHMLCQCVITSHRDTLSHVTYRRTHIPVRGRAHPNHLTRIAEDSARHAATLHASLRSAERSRTKTSKAKLRSRSTDRTGKDSLAQQPASQVASLGKEGQDREG